MDDRMHPSLMAESLAREIRGALGEFNNNDLAVVALVRDLAKAHSAHFAQPAQAVDVGAIREVAFWLTSNCHWITGAYEQGQKLTRAIGNAHE